MKHHWRHVMLAPMYPLPLLPRQSVTKLSCNELLHHPVFAAIDI